MTDDLLYEERLSSNRTTLLFLVLMALFALLMGWRVLAVRFDALAVVFLGLAGFFLFYVVNYRTLVIRLDAESLALNFGLFTWKVPGDNIVDCRLDSIPLFMRMGGAGIHFMMIRKRYRASFNFLQYPRVVIALRKKAGPVQDISFSTRRPDEVIHLIEAMRKPKSRVTDMES